MKLWKKTLAMLMCCGFVFSTAACTDDSGSGSGSGNGDGGNEEQVLTEKKNYLSAIADSLVNAKSFKVELDASLSQSDDNSEMDMTIEGDIALSQNAKDEKLFDMGLTLSVNGTDKHDSNGDGDFKDEYETNKVEESIKLYVKDGYVYMGQEVEGEMAWMKYYKPYNEVLAEEMGETLPEDVTNVYLEMFDKILENKLVTGTVDAVKTGVAQTAEIKDDMFVIAFDAKALVNDTVELLAGDPTIEELGDYALAMVDEELTVESILDKVASYGEKTVMDVYGEVDAWLEENYEKGVQEIVELVTKDQAILDSLEEAGLESSALEAFENFNVEETLTSMLEAYEMEEMTIDEIIAMMMAGEMGGTALMASEEAPKFTLEAMVEQLKTEMLSKKLSETMDEEDWAVAEEILGKIEVNALSASFGAKYGNDNKVNYIEVAMDVDFDFAMESWNDEEEKSEFVDALLAESFTIKVSNISASKSAIEFPEELKDAVEFGGLDEECSKCEKMAEHEISVHSFGDLEVTGYEYLCGDHAERCMNYVNCQNEASHKMMSAYYCDKCWNNVADSLK